MAIPATQMRPGMVIKHNNDLHSVFSVEHRTPGNLRAFIQAKLRNLRTGAMFEHRFRSGDAIERITVDEVQMEFLYADGDDYHFMNTENYEQLHLNRDILGDAVDYLIPNLQLKIEFFDGKAVGVELPQTVELTVVETEPGLKSATASRRYQGGKDGDWPSGASAAVYQRRREDPRGHVGRRVSVAGVSTFLCHPEPSRGICGACALLIDIC